MARRSTSRSRSRNYPAAYPLVLFLADTGARLGEASALRWIELDLSRDYMFANYLARVSIDIDGLGILIGECNLDPEKVELIR